MANTIDLDRYFKERERNVHEVYGLVFVTDGFGKIVAKYNPVALGVEWFNMSNDMFFSVYGFNWVPRGQVYDEARKLAFNERR